MIETLGAEIKAWRCSNNDNSNSNNNNVLISMKSLIRDTRCSLWNPSPSRERTECAILQSTMMGTMMHKMPYKDKLDNSHSIQGQ